MKRSIYLLRHFSPVLPSRRMWWLREPRTCACIHRIDLTNDNKMEYFVLQGERGKCSENSLNYCRLCDARPWCVARSIYFNAIWILPFAFDISTNKSLKHFSRIRFINPLIWIHESCVWCSIFQSIFNKQWGAPMNVISELRITKKIEYKNKNARAINISYGNQTKWTKKTHASADVQHSFTWLFAVYFLSAPFKNLLSIFF